MCGGLIEGEGRGADGKGKKEREGNEGREGKEGRRAERQVETRRRETGELRHRRGHTWAAVGLIIQNTRARRSVGEPGSAGERKLFLDSGRAGRLARPM
ncbi:uncharacterized protein K452DRAFT_18785 [Aplosporella prunicola CBS 121167]|uniref:Uncharacterized protein n=1 Tax=Aplosporella prunicola CBS 121167 TaxID=1176127 RepID=A0A6A6BE43_9PEZI|nr:uncharacterized protein K452DRAFT_18785 [Aplosporella prunicola CBS 121167]KAF2142439.1 hypothetical protein K452DRAFT_18785 [Aplosporella prunicola CBS 121167]